MFGITERFDQVGARPRDSRSHRADRAVEHSSRFRVRKPEYLGRDEGVPSVGVELLDQRTELTDVSGWGVVLGARDELFVAASLAYPPSGRVSAGPPSDLAHPVKERSVATEPRKAGEHPLHRVLNKVVVFLAVAEDRDKTSDLGRDQHDEALECLDVTGD